MDSRPVPGSRPRPDRARARRHRAPPLAGHAARRQRDRAPRRRQRGARQAAQPLPIRQLVEKARPGDPGDQAGLPDEPAVGRAFLKPGAIAFDLLVFDEASQVGRSMRWARSRARRRSVVVGDSASCRRPASSTSSPATTTRGRRGAASPATREIVESILGPVLAKGVPERMLRWHYRSRHESLIAVSNREFYDNRLFVFPSPDDAVAGMGLSSTTCPNAPTTAAAPGPTRRGEGGRRGRVAPRPRAVPSRLARRGARSARRSARRS